MRSALAVAFVLLATPVPAQQVMSTGKVTQDQNGNIAGSMTYHPVVQFLYACIGAPYSAETIQESEWVQADGTRTRLAGFSGRVWRDSQGRVRNEQAVMESSGRGDRPPVVVEIGDPVEGAFYVLDDVMRVAHRIKFPPPPAGPVPAAAPTPPMRTTESSEPLGFRLIEGFLVEGTRISETIPEGHKGSDQPITTVTEIWRSAELDITILSVSDNPRSGLLRTLMKNISRTEPDPALFRVPAGYTVVDETGPFTIQFSGKR